MSVGATVALPAASFAVLAAELRVLLRREVDGNDQVEIFMAGMKEPSAMLHACHADMLHATARLADIYHLLRRLAPIEREVRALAQQHTPSQESSDEQFPAKSLAR